MNSINRIINNTKRFQDLYFKENRDNFKKIVAEGQSPETLFITCSDSRVMPSLLTDTREGDLFVIRNVGNFIPPFDPDSEYHGTATGIEYAVQELGVKNIIVCGHSYCGACAALHAEDNEHTPHITKWLKLGEKAKRDVLEVTNKNPDTTPEEIARLTERFSLINQLDNLLTYPHVKKLLKEKELTIYGWYYKLEDGTIEQYDQESKEFKPL